MWWKNGPYSPQLERIGNATNKGKTVLPSVKDVRIIKKIKNGKQMLMDFNKAELVASYLYLTDRLNKTDSDEIERELVTRKPYLSSAKVHQTMKEWNRIVDLPLASYRRRLSR